MLNSRFDKFTEGAQQVFSLAKEEAKRFNHNYVGTEHILLGLLKQEEEIAARVLNGLAVDLSEARSAVEFIVGRGEVPSRGEIGPAPRVYRVMELAVDEARRMSHGYIGTEHLLIGLLREGEGVAAGVLDSLGVTLEKVRPAARELGAAQRTSEIQANAKAAFLSAVRELNTLSANEKEIRSTIASKEAELEELRKKYAEVTDQIAASLEKMSEASRHLPRSFFT